MSFPRYPKYKDSGVEWLGEVPEHWTLRRLGYYFDERREKVSDRDYPALSVTKNGIVPQLETAAKTDDGDNRKRVCAGDFVINSRSDRKGSAGVADIEGSVSLICTVLAFRAEVLPAFVHHLLRSVPFQEEFYRFGKGIVADLWSTNYGEMRNILLAVPTIPEQATIAAFLDRETAKIDALIAEQQRLIELLQEKRQAVISHAVTKGLNPDVPMKDSGIEWLGEVPKHWRVRPLKSVISRIEQGWSPQCESYPADHGEWGVLKVGCVNAARFRAEEQKALPQGVDPMPVYEVHEGDILASRGNTLELVGMAAFLSAVRGRLLLSDLLYRFRAKPTEANGEYLACALRSPFARYQIERDAVGTSASMKKVGQSVLRELLMPLPPLEEQDAIMVAINETGSEIERLAGEAERAITLLQERRSALISAAVTGQIDVRGLAGSEAA